MKRKRLTPQERREIILRGATRAAEKHGGVFALTQQNVADECEIETSLWTVKHYFPTMKDLRDAVQRSGA